jgi:DNA-binding transcriptional regulator YdaS (Cro superfamily)
VSFETALAQWQDGVRRLAEAPPEQQRMLERVTQAVEAELRRRLGGRFTSQELADFYEQGTDWTVDIAVAVAPEDPYAWDVRTVADAAFGRYLRGATDYAGGRRLRFE